MPRINVKNEFLSAKNRHRRRRRRDEPAAKIFPTKSLVRYARIPFYDKDLHFRLVHLPFGWVARTHCACE